MARHLVYDIVCSAGERCTLYDPETETPWWNHVATKQDMFDNIQAHLDVCAGPMQVARLATGGDNEAGVLESLYNLNRSELRRVAWEALLISDGPDHIDDAVAYSPIRVACDRTESRVKFIISPRNDLRYIGRLRRPEVTDTEPEGTTP